MINSHRNVVRAGGLCCIGGWGCCGFYPPRTKVTRAREKRAWKRDYND